MKNNKAMIFGLMGMMAAMSSNHTDNIRTTNDNLINRRRERKDIIPNGCKQYFFTATGLVFETYKPSGYEVVFECVALNVKSAHKKFDKYNLGVNHPKQ